MSELAWTSMADLARRIAAKEVSPVEVVQAHLDRIAALDGRIKAYITVMADAALAAGQGGRARADLGGPARPASRRPGRPQGSLQHQGREDHGRLARPRRVHAGRGRHRGHAAARRRRHRAGQAQHARVRLRARGPQPALRHAVEPVGLGDAPDLRRVLVRVGGGGGGGPVPGRARLGHRRVDPHPGRPVRPQRDQAHLWPGEPRRRAAAGVVARPRRTHVPQRARLRAHARPDGRLRPARSHHEPAAGPGLRVGAERVGEGPARRPPAALLPGVGGSADRGGGRGGRAQAGGSRRHRQRRRARDGAARGGRILRGDRARGLCVSRGLAQGAAGRVRPRRAPAPPGRRVRVRIGVPEGPARARPDPRRGHRAPWPPSTSCWRPPRPSRPRRSAWTRSRSPDGASPCAPA